mgnify:FL=1
MVIRVQPAVDSLKSGSEPYDDSDGIWYILELLMGLQIWGAIDVATLKDLFLDESFSCERRCQLASPCTGSYRETYGHWYERPSKVFL